MRFLIVFIWFFSASVLAVEGTLTCTPPTEREDGTPLPLGEIASYQLYEDGIATLQASNCAFPVSVPTGEARTYTVRTVDTYGNISVDSNSIFVSAVPPNPPILIFEVLP